MLLALLILPPAGAAGQPDTMRVAGQTLHLSGHGTHTKLVFVELYRVALYVPRRMQDPAAIQQPDVAKAIIVEIRYDGSMPDRIPSGWREELVPVLTPEERRTLQHHYERLEQRDTVDIIYDPRQGTTVSINGRHILHGPDDTIVNAFLELWIGSEPVAEELKKALL